LLTDKSPSALIKQGDEGLLAWLSIFSDG